MCVSTSLMLRFYDFTILEGMQNLVNQLNIFLGLM